MYTSTKQIQGNLIVNKVGYSDNCTSYFINYRYIVIVNMPTPNLVSQLFGDRARIRGVTVLNALDLVRRKLCTSNVCS